MVFVPGIAPVTALVIVIRKVHTVVQITEERVQLWRAALRSAEYACISSMITPIVPMSLIVTTSSFLGVAALTQKETKSYRSELIVVDAISTRSERQKFTQFVDRKLKMPPLTRCVPRSLKNPLKIMTARVQPWKSTLFLVVIVPGTKKVVP